MAENKKVAQFIPMTSTQAAIGGAVLVGFFTLWSLWAAIGASVIFWIESHSGLASWIQAIGSIGAIVAVAYIARLDHYRQNKKDEEIINNERRMINYKMNKFGIKNDIESYLYYFFLFHERWCEKNESNYGNIRLFKLLINKIKKTRNSINELNAIEFEKLYMTADNKNIMNVFYLVELIFGIFENYSELLEEIPEKKWISHPEDDLDRINEELGGAIVLIMKNTNELKISFKSLVNKLS